MEKTKTEALAEEILLKAKTELTGNIHSLIRAINALQFVPTNEEDVFTDATSFYYNPQFILLCPLCFFPNTATFLFL